MPNERPVKSPERAQRQRRIAMIVVGALLAAFVIPFLAIILS